MSILSRVGVYTFLLFVLVNCATDQAEEMKPEKEVPIAFCDTVSFSQHVLPIFTSICANPSCHVTGGAGPFPLTNHNEISAKTDLILPAIKHTGVLKMPLNPADFSVGEKLSDEKINIITCWVEAGKPNN